MLVNILLGVLGVLFSAVTLAALLFAVVFFAAAGTCGPDAGFFCKDGGSAWAVLGLFGLAIASLPGILAFWFWQALHRRIVGDPDAWWLWYEKRRTGGPTVTAEWLRDVNRECAQKVVSGAEAKREEGDS